MNENDLRVIKTKECINEALLNCLSVYPFEKITVNMITSMARINRSTFYKYYLDKYDLLDKYLALSLEEFRLNMNAEFMNADINEIKNFIYSNNFKNIIKFFNSRSNTYEILWESVMERNIFDEMLNIIQENMLEVIKNDIEGSKDKYNIAVLYCKLFSSNLMITIKWWLKEGKDMTVEEICKITDLNMQNGVFHTFRKLMESN